MKRFHATVFITLEDKASEHDAARIIEDSLAHNESVLGFGVSDAHLHTPTHGYGCPHDGDPLTQPKPADCVCDDEGETPVQRHAREAYEATRHD